MYLCQMFVKLHSQKLSCCSQSCQQPSPGLMQDQSHISTFRSAAVVKLGISKQADIANPRESK